MKTTVILLLLRSNWSLLLRGLAKKASSLYVNIAWFGTTIMSFQKQRCADTKTVFQPDLSCTVTQRRKQCAIRSGWGRYGQVGCRSGSLHVDLEEPQHTWKQVFHFFFFLNQGRLTFFRENLLFANFKPCHDRTRYHISVWWLSIFEWTIVYIFAFCFIFGSKRSCEERRKATAKWPVICAAHTLRPHPDVLYTYITLNGSIFFSFFFSFFPWLLKRENLKSGKHLKSD